MNKSVAIIISNELRFHTILVFSPQILLPILIQSIRENPKPILNQLFGAIFFLLTKKYIAKEAALNVIVA